MLNRFQLPLYKICHLQLSPNTIIHCVTQLTIRCLHRCILMNRCSRCWISRDRNWWKGYRRSRLREKWVLRIGKWLMGKWGEILRLLLCRRMNLCKIICKRWIRILSLWDLRIHLLIHLYWTAPPFLRIDPIP